MSLLRLIVGLALLGFVGILAAKLLPSYVEYWSVRKVFAAMEKNGETNGTPQEIRHSYERRNLIEDIKSVDPSDLQINKEGGQTVVTAEWSVKVPLVANISACIDFTASTGGASAASDATQ
ncbi:MAG TPA: DUF4845 domain-containing protein [Usitatibacter sp.]|nr:DUF4845 domain-containing protein [Usitatibacter sp.]